MYSNMPTDFFFQALDGQLEPMTQLRRVKVRVTVTGNGI